MGKDAAATFQRNHADSQNTAKPSTGDATDRERAARKELIKRKRWKRQQMVVAKVAEDKNAIQALQSKVAAVEADESQAEAELDSVKKKEAVWQGFVDSTQGAAKQQFRQKLKNAQRDEAEAKAAIKDYKKNADEIENEIQEDTAKMNAKGKGLVTSP